MPNTITNNIENNIQQSALATALLIVDIELLSALPKPLFDGLNEALNTNKITNDSRTVMKNDIFCAVIGNESDGRNFITKAIVQGASVVLRQCDTRAEHGAIIVRPVNQLINHEDMSKRSTDLINNIIIIDIYELNDCLFNVAQAFYQYPDESMKMIGITGTNGKTSTAIILAQLLHACENKVAVIGTVGAGVLPHLAPITNTTPGATETLSLIHDFKRENVSHLAMEVSSHALDQKRVIPDLFNIAVFTNLSRDHLDYHVNMAAYADAKFSLFNSQKSQVSIINGDDKYAKTWLNNRTAFVGSRVLIVFGKNQTIAQQYSQGYVLANNLKYSTNGLTFTLKTHIGQCIINSPLLGDFNVDNLLAAIAVLISLDFSLNNIQSAIKVLTPIVGRMETFSSENRPLAIVDYAHTPDGLENALIAAKKHSQSTLLDSKDALDNDCLTQRDTKLWLVFGCGGDRDKGKRAEMGTIAEQYADHIILTNDNPRTEAPQEIFNDILMGCNKPGAISIISNRSLAVKAAFEKANPNDCILFAGKGHEEYIIVGDDKKPYNERKLVQTYYQEAM